MPTLTTTSLLLSPLLILLASTLHSTLHPPSIYNIHNLQQWYQDGDYMNFQGRPVFYKQSSSSNKPHLLLLHGYPTSSYDFSQLWTTTDLCTTQFHCITIDFIGYGLSDKSLPMLSNLTTQASVVEQLVIRELGLHSVPVSIVAHDIGVSVVQELLARVLDRQESEHKSPAIRWKSIILLNGGLFPEQHRALLTQKALATPVVGHLIQALIPVSLFTQSVNKVFGPQTQLTDEEGSEHYTALLHNAHAGHIYTLQQYIAERRLQRKRWVGALNSTQTTINPPIPTRLINGGHDPISGHHLLAHYQNVIVEPDVVALPSHLGHYPHIEDPQTVFKEIIRYHKQLGTLK